MNKGAQGPAPARIDPATVAQPVPVAMLTEPPSALSSGSALNRASSGWPTLLDGGAKFWNGGWRQSFLKPVETVKEPANYGSRSSLADYGFRYRAFGGVGNYSNVGAKNPYVKEYNDLVPIQWGLRIPNPNIAPMSVAQQGPITVQTKPSTWQGSNTASLVRNGVTLL
jgi:hypothetical protein